MQDRPLRILISNDDGIDAPGLAALEAAAARLAAEVWTVAPDGNRSGYAHGISLRRQIEVRRVAPGRYACSGTPADCVIAGIGWVLRGQDGPDLVLSGINEGRNVAEDSAYSGTMAVAREAAMRGIPAIAFSRPRDGEAFDAGALDWLAQRIDAFWQARADWAQDGHWLSVNLPRRLPAQIRSATIGRDKIAQRIRVHRESEEMAVIEPLPERDYRRQPGDENHLIEAGIASVVCLNWLGQAEVPSGALREIAPALGERQEAPAAGAPDMSEDVRP